MRVLVHPTTGQKFHVGGRRRPAPRPKRMLGKYMASGFTLPAAPSLVDYTKMSDGTKVPGLANILGNDRLGDCTSAGIWHYACSVNAMAGAPLTVTEADAIKFYSLSTGYDPSNPASDQGGDEDAVLDYAAAHGLDGNGLHAIKGRIDVDPTNVPLMRSIVWLFGGLYFGVELPDAWTQNMPSGDGFLWTPGAPNPADGHCFVGLGANDTGILIDTWGLDGTIRYDAVAQLCVDNAGGELHAILTKESLARATSLCPAGIDWAQLVADFDAEGGAVPASSP